MYSPRRDFLFFGLFLQWLGSFYTISLYFGLVGYFLRFLGLLSFDLFPCVGFWFWVCGPSFCSCALKKCLLASQTFLKRTRALPEAFLCVILVLEIILPSEFVSAS